MDSLLRRNVPRILRFVRDRRRRMPRGPAAQAPRELLPRDKALGGRAATGPADEERFFDALGVRDYGERAAVGAASGASVGGAVHSLPLGAKQVLRTTGIPSANRSSLVAEMQEKLGDMRIEDNENTVSCTAQSSTAVNTAFHAGENFSDNFTSDNSAAAPSPNSAIVHGNPSAGSLASIGTDGSTGVAVPLVTESPSAALASTHDVLGQVPRHAPMWEDRPAARTLRSLVREHGGVEGALAALAAGTTAVAPGASLVNEALLHYTCASRFGDAARLLSDYGPSATEEIVAHGHVIRGETERALQALQSVRHPFSSPVAGQTYSSVLLALRRAGRSDAGHALFLSSCERAAVAPPAALVATALSSLALEDCVEQAFLVHGRLCAAALDPAKRLAPSAAVHAALIHAASKRREHFGRALALFREMRALGLRVGARVYGDMLYACAKASALPAAMALWREALACADGPPTAATATNYLWALASAENPAASVRHSRHRPFFWAGLAPEDLSAAAHEVVAWAERSGARPNSHMLVALLAVHANHGLRAQAEEIFWRRLWAPGADAQPYGHEHMLRMYDLLRDYGAARAIYAHYREHFVQPRTNRATARLPYEGWRALARTAALAGHLDDALGHVEAMRAEQGHVPDVSDLRAVHLRACEAGRPDLVARLAAACRPRDINGECGSSIDRLQSALPLAAASRRTVADLLSTAAPSCSTRGAHRRTMERSLALGTLLGRVYGRDGPKCATDATRLSPRSGSLGKD